MAHLSKYDFTKECLYKSLETFAYTLKDMLAMKTVFASVTNSEKIL